MANGYARLWLHESDVFDAMKAARPSCNVWEFRRGNVPVRGVVFCVLESRFPRHIFIPPEVWCFRYFFLVYIDYILGMSMEVRING